MAETSAVTPARQILPGQTVFITSRAVGRTFRFVPKPKVVETLTYCFVTAVAKYDVAVHEFLYMSNHLHLVLTVRGDELPDFMQYLNSLTSRALNALRGRSGSNFESHYNMVTVADPIKALEHCAYTLANPCAADLVTRAGGWKSLTSFNLEYGQELTVERPADGLWAPSKLQAEAKHAKKKSRRRKSAGRAKYAGRSSMPEQVSMKLVRPPGFNSMTDEALRDEVRRQVVVRESEAENKRVANGRKVLGMKRVRAQHWNDYPRKTESILGPVPKASGSNLWARLEVLSMNAAFQRAYRRARAAFIAGERNVEFPHGTWQMRRLFNVRCAESLALA